MKTSDCSWLGANAPKELGAVDIELTVRGKPVSVPAQAYLRLLPDPSLVIEFKADDTGIFHAKDIGPGIRLLPEGVPFKVNATAVSARYPANKVRGTLIPLSQPCTVLRKARQRLQAVRFSLINFPDFLGTQDLTVKDGKGARRRSGRAQMTAGPWHIELAAVPNLKELNETLKRDGGYAIAHIGTIRRTDGKTFGIKDAEHALESVRQFLSFARGGFCSPALETGLNRHGERVWQRWGAGNTLPWIYTSSWFDRMHGQLLSEVFPGFWDRYNDPAWKDTVVAALYWYLRSNAHGRGAGIDGGLVLTQAGLERLAHDLGHSGKSAAQRLCKALKAAGIDTRLPSACRKIKRLAGKHGWRDGPHALTAIRNGLTHPVRGYELLPTGALYEAWNLGQWYIELLLLHLFGHTGQYGNRLTQKWRGQVVSVPWA